MTVRQSNPFRRLRINSGISQYELGRRAGVSKHAVLRLEQGMYDSPLPTLVEYFLNHYDISQVTLLAEYEAFQIATREDNKRLLGNIPILLKQRPVGTHPLVFLRSLIGMNPTELAKRLCISQSAIVNFEKKPVAQHTVPVQLITALQDADYTEEETNSLEDAYSDFRNGVITAQNVRVVPCAS